MLPLCSQDNHPQGKPVRVIRRISEKEGDALVAARKATWVQNADGFLVGYQLIGERVRAVFVPGAPSKATQIIAALKKIEGLPRQLGADARIDAGNVADPVSSPSNTAFSRAEVEAIAGLRGKSRTMRMSEQQRKSRILRNLIPEDLIESAQRKFEVYPDVH